MTKDYYKKNRERILQRAKEAYSKLSKDERKARNYRIPYDEWNEERRLKHLEGSREAYKNDPVARSKALARTVDWRKRHSSQAAYNVLRNNAKVRGLKVEITRVEFERDFWLKPCFYCDSEAKGLDRVDSSSGYLKFNIVPCCWRCNAAKNNMSLEEFKEHITKIYTRLQTLCSGV
jgi:hypothetical protein